MNLEPQNDLELLAEALNQPRLFVTGTDTEIGKTLVSCKILELWRKQNHEAVGIKPIATGCEKREDRWINEDALLLGENSSDKGKNILSDEGEIPGDPLVGFLRPLAPRTAAKLEDRKLDLSDIDARVQKISKSCLNHDVRLVVEGLGGAMVPLADGYFIADWISDLAFPAVVVCRTELGTISHTTLVIECLRKRGVNILGIIGSRTQSGEMSNVEKSSVQEIHEQHPNIPMMVLDYLT